MTSEGVAVFPDANQDPNANPAAKKTPDVQVAFEGIYLPTAPAQPPFVRSTFPARHDEGITLLAYRGDTGLDTGTPRSVYSLDQKQVTDGKLKPLESKFLRKGESWTLDDGSKVTFVDTQEWASLEISHDPGRMVALGGAVAMVAGLLVSLFTRRRRVFIRMKPGEGGTTVELAGLARADSPAFRAEFERVVAAIRGANGGETLKSKDDHAGK
jgi:cytochrome c biogenesis protein